MPERVNAPCPDMFAAQPRMVNPFMDMMGAPLSAHTTPTPSGRASATLAGSLAGMGTAGIVKRRKTETEFDAAPVRRQSLDLVRFYFIYF